MPPRKKPEEEVSEPQLSDKENEENRLNNIVIKTDIEYLEKYVVAELGKPNDFMSCKAIHLFKRRYRVNVYVKHDGSQKILESFYAKSCADGFTFSPPLNSKYLVKKK